MCNKATELPFPLPTIDLGHKKGLAKVLSSLAIREHYLANVLSFLSSIVNVLS